MNCYLCGHLAEYSCRCSVPIVLICHDHLKAHREDKSKKHALDFLEDKSQINLFNDIKEKLRKSRQGIILNSINQIKQIEDDTKQSLCLVTKLMQDLHKKYGEKALNKNFLEEMMSCFVHEIDRKRFNNYILLENYKLIINKENIRNIEIQRHSGDVYIGECKNGLRDGHGICKFLSDGPDKGCIYDGE